MTLVTELKVNNDPDWARFYLGWGEDKTEFCVMKCCVFVILWYFLTDGDSMASDKTSKTMFLSHSIHQNTRLKVTVVASLFGFYCSLHIRTKFYLFSFTRSYTNFNVWELWLVNNKIPPLPPHLSTFKLRVLQIFAATSQSDGHSSVIFILIIKRYLI